MQLLEIIKEIEKTAHLDKAAAWDCSGMQVATAQQDIRALAVCLDPSPHSVRQALENGANFVLSHHPLLLKARLPRNLDAYHEVLRLLFTHNVGLYAAHTSLDTNLGGPAGWLALELALEHCTVLEPINSDPASGFGFVGTLPQPLDYNVLLAKLCTLLPLQGAQSCGMLPGTVSRLACCPGSGTSLLDLAAKSGADLYLTGDVKYHTALETTLGILDIGHHGIEEEMMRRFAALLTKQCPQIRVFFIPSRSPFHSVSCD